MADGRPSWDEVWMNVAFDVARRSRCVNARVGCVIVSKQNTAAAVSYNGPPAHYRPALDVRTDCKTWCPHAMDPNGGRSDYMDCVSSHAEANGLMQADRRHIVDGTAYVTRVPCWTCAKMLGNSGLIRVVCPMDREEDEDRPIGSAIDIMRESGLAVVNWRFDVAS